MPNPHPLVVHFPIALFLVAVACELIAYFTRSRLLSVGSLVASVAAALGAFAAVVTGLFAKQIVPRGTQAEIVAGSHETMGYVMLACAIAFVSMKLWQYYRNDDRVLTPLIAVGLVGVVVTVITAHEGGQLVYTHGVGVEQTPPEDVLKNYPYGSAPWKESALDDSKSSDSASDSNQSAREEISVDSLEMRSE